MAQVTASVEVDVPAPPAAVHTALADYATTRPAILPEQCTDYAVESGGTGSGTVATWRLHATRKRVRHVVVEVATTTDTVTETDRNSSMVTVYVVAPTTGGSRVTATTTWDGAGGVGGFFERTFAPRGLARIHTRLLDNLGRHLGGA